MNGNKDICHFMEYVIVFKILTIHHHYKEKLNMYKATVSGHSAVKYRCHQIYCTVRNVTYIIQLQVGTELCL